MDVAKRLADWRDQPPEQWFTAINRYLPPVVTAILVIAIAYQLATLTWTARARLGAQPSRPLRAQRPTTMRRLRRIYQRLERLAPVRRGRRASQRPSSRRSSMRPTRR